ncbi:MAG: GntR family transcriptional regulator [Chloroflexota bacterium]|nr:GntR family transcriptional regulator [Chloroflexota bacterium]
MNKLEPNSSTPLYQQLTKCLIEKIEAKVYKRGQKIPSIRQLAKKYGVSNITVIRALEELRQLQYVYSVQGKGYFVSHHHIIQKYMPTQDGFSNMAEKEGMTPSSIVLRAEIQKAGKEMGGIFGISEDSEVILLERIRLVDDFPLCIQVSYLPHELCPNLLKLDFKELSLYQMLREKYHISMAKSQYNIQAGLAESRELRHLELESPAAILWVWHWAFEAPGRLFEYGESAYRGDCFQISSPINEYEIINEIIA